MRRLSLADRIRVFIHKHGVGSLISIVALFFSVLSFLNSNRALDLTVSEIYERESPIIVADYDRKADELSFSPASTDYRIFEAEMFFPTAVAPEFFWIKQFPNRVSKREVVGHILDFFNEKFKSRKFVGGTLLPVPVPVVIYVRALAHGRLVVRYGYYLVWFNLFQEPGKAIEPSFSHLEFRRFLTRWDLPALWFRDRLAPGGTDEFLKQEWSKVADQLDHKIPIVKD